MHNYIYMYTLYMCMYLCMRICIVCVYIANLVFIILLLLYLNIRMVFIKLLYESLPNKNSNDVTY